MRNTYIVRAVLFFLLLTSTYGRAQAPSLPKPSWQHLQFLVGAWSSAGSTQLGEGNGKFSFEPQLNRYVLVRRSFAEYKSGPAAGTRHDDLMIIYAGAPHASPHAIYFDSEGHVIRYNVSFPAANAAVFESESAQPSPRFRLSYVLDGKILKGRFEVAPPNAEYKTYLSWQAERIQPTK
jgi:hypothetical protein